MITPVITLVVLCLAFSTFAQQEQCEYSYGTWNDCINYSQTRSVSCLCDGVLSDLSLCNSTLPVTEQQCECKWIWSKWSRCTAECGGGNTTRIPQCFCNSVLSDDSKCDVNYYFGRETVSCNEYDCGEVPALNKLYWITEEAENWPIDNQEFNCSKGFDPEDSPKGMTYFQVLTSDPVDHLHPEWFYLAKEWITAKLNEANGVEFALDYKKIIVEVGDMLEQCMGWRDPEQIALIYSLKEKLGRLNNNIGGLGNVDTQLSIVLGKNQEEEQEASRLSFILVIAIPLVAVVIVAVALGLVVYYIRQKTNDVAKDKFESEDEEDALNALTDKPVDNDQIVLDNQEEPLSAPQEAESESDD